MAKKRPPIAAKYIYDRGFVTKDEVSVCTLAGVKTVRLERNGSKAKRESRPQRPLAYEAGAAKGR